MLQINKFVCKEIGKGLSTPKRLSDTMFLKLIK